MADRLLRPGDRVEFCDVAPEWRGKQGTVRRINLSQRPEYNLANVVFDHRPDEVGFFFSRLKLIDPLPTTPFHTSLHDYIKRELPHAEPR